MTANQPAPGQTSALPVRAGYHTASPYLIVKNATAALRFYASAFGAVEIRRLSTPDGKIMHSEMKIGDSIVMLADEFPSHQAFGPEHFGGSPMSVVLCVDNVDARFARALDAGATILRPLEDQFSGDRSGTLLDPFGHRWILTMQIEDLPEAEITRRFNAMMNLGSATAADATTASKSK
jgi:PhnB protein